MKQLFMLWGLLFFGLLHAQSPAISLQLDAGPARPWTQREDPYAERTPAWQVNTGASAGLVVGLSKHLAFTPEAGLEYDRFKQLYGSTKDLRDVDANLHLLYGRLSPSITLSAGVVSLRAGIATMTSLATLGQYAMRYYDPTQGRSQTITYADHFGRIRNPFLLGPELSLGCDFPLPDDGGSFGFRVTGFLSANRVFKADFNTPFNPLLSRLNLGLRYVLPE